MRLIDADKIPTVKAPIAPILRGDETHYERVALKWDIDRQPTIQAIPIPDGATNGDMVKAVLERCSHHIEVKRHEVVYNNVSFRYHGIDVEIYQSEKVFFTLWFPKDWWNAPYRREVE